MSEFEGKIILITGGTRGIGKAIAYQFAKNKATVFVTSRNESITFLDDIKRNNLDIISIQSNVSKLDNCVEVVKYIEDNYGKIDILVNNAGITKDKLMLRMTEQDFDDVLDVNLKGTWNMIKATTKGFIKKKSGRIINISSVVGIIGNPGQANYVASKSAVIGMTKSLAKEFGMKNITVNAVAPGFIETDMTSKLNEDVKNYYLNQIPLKRFGSAEEIAETVLFLASDKASYITGQVISVNGGMI